MSTVTASGSLLTTAAGLPITSQRKTGFLALTNPLFQLLACGDCSIPATSPIAPIPGVTHVIHRLHQSTTEGEQSRLQTLQGDAEVFGATVDHSRQLVPLTAECLSPFGNNDRVGKRLKLAPAKVRYFRGADGAGAPIQR